MISPAAQDLARRAMNYTSEKPLYVAAIGAITNIASALLINPEIRERMVVIWLGGHALHWHDIMEFNMRQDIPAARVVLGCGVPVVLLPCQGVVSSFTTTEYELRWWLVDKNPLSDYLARRMIATAHEYAKGKPWSRVIWDVATISWLMDEEGRYMLDKIIPAPMPSPDGQWTYDETRHSIRYVYGMYRDYLMEKLFTHLLQE